MKVWLTAAGALAMLSGCSGLGYVNNALADKTQHVEYYRIYDIKTNADRYAMADAASVGLGKNVNSATEARPIPSGSELPEKPGRFTLKDPFEHSPQMAALMSGQALGYKVATCSDASWTAKAVRDVPGSNNLNLTACLFPYKQGYHLDIYATFTKQEGGLMQAVRSGVNSVVGTPEEWTEKTFVDIVREIKKETKGDVTFVEGYPKVQGTPWLDSGEQVQAAK